MYGMGRRRAILYSRITLNMPELIESTLGWTRRRYRVERIVTENSEKQSELRQLLGTKGVAVIAPDAFHLAAPDRLPCVLASAAATVVLVRERMILSRRQTADVFRFAKSVAMAHTQTRRHHVRLALLCAKLIGKQLGRPALSGHVRDHALDLLKEGKSLRMVARETGISKTTAPRLSKRLKR